jgi:hypothetical protein
LQAKRVADRLADKKIKLELKDSAVDFLARKGYDPVFGARWGFERGRGRGVREGREKRSEEICVAAAHTRSKVAAARCGMLAYLRNWVSIS